jgi:hypothetical protein
MELNSRIWNQAFTLGLTVITALMIALTIFFAYNSSAERPLTRTLIFTNPSTNILVLNVLSQLSIFCLSELTTWVFAAVRWSFASSLSGIPAYTFLALSRATSSIGVLTLLLGRSEPGYAKRDSHRFWGGQRFPIPFWQNADRKGYSSSLSEAFWEFFCFPMFHLHLHILKFIPILSSKPALPQ